LTLITDLSLTITPYTDLYGTVVPDAQITPHEINAGGRKSIVLDFNNGDGLYAGDLGTIFQWPTNSLTVLDAWQPSIIPMPEGIYDRASDWDDGGEPGAKYIQGVIVEADSFNTTKTFLLQDSDTLQMHALNECPVAFNKQSEIAFSCAVPFVAHSVRVISTDGVEWRVWQARLVFQPWPELCRNWQTEMTSLGMIGWAHAREMNIAHLSTADLTLILTFDGWPAITLTIPNSAGTQKKVKVTLPPNKFKLIGFRLFSTEDFRLFLGDVELKVKDWGSTGEYQILRPFGGKTIAGATV
jgi:hypothetical protein